MLLAPVWFPWALHAALVLCKCYSDVLHKVCYAVGCKGKATVTCLRSEVVPEGRDDSVSSARQEACLPELGGRSGAESQNGAFLSLGLDRTEVNST